MNFQRIALHRFYFYIVFITTLQRFITYLYTVIAFVTDNASLTFNKDSAKLRLIFLFLHCECLYGTELRKLTAYVKFKAVIIFLQLHKFTP